MKFEQLRQSSKRQLARMAGFYLSVVAFLFIWLMIFGAGMTGGFRVWFDPSLVDIHVVHNVTFFYFIWVFGLAMLVQLYKPKNRVTTMQMALLISIIALLENAPQFASEAFNPMLLVFLAPVFIAAALHPARNEVFSREQLSRDALNRPLLGLAAIALVPVGLYAAGQMNLQLTLTDDHAAVGHYGSIASYGIVFVLFAALASLGGQGRRAAAYAAAFLAIIFAAISTLYPAVSAISLLWSGAAVLWALAVIGTYEWSGRRPDLPLDDVSMEEPTETA